MGVGAQVMTPAVKDEVNTAGHPEEVSMESQEMILMPEDHDLELVAVLEAILGPELSSANTTAIEVTFQPLFAISSNPPLTRPLEAYMVVSIAITIDQAIVTSNAPSTIPTNRSATLEPILISTLGTPALVVDTIMPEHQLEIIVNPSTKDGRGIAMVPHDGAPLPFPDQPFDDFFDFLNQWDASISSIKASTRIVTSSTTAGPYQIPGLRPYFSHTVIYASCLIGK
ncbi:PREDICTED: PRUPE_4G245100 [Prunus dulcis]|uniref:PREDICTED: PRUPE_4G245100 n=1 Tax=Prunus dulcis TaxID=3755 RepID=A0A5E4G0X5_PRUDU|nr:hypothetical protein L3X38_041828 [Prunus dulcis]VVA33344.1 PREDICTED: PRUPE_4G245100 [Prunus dulcis]